MWAGNRPSAWGDTAMSPAPMTALNPGPAPDLVCLHCRGELSIEMEYVGPAYLSYDRPECIQCDRCGAEWTPAGKARCGPRWSVPASHVTPSREIDHEVSEDCPCGPTASPVKRGDGSCGWVYIHHSLDGREIREVPADA